jgi:signal transduction histidine kinase
MCLCFCFLITPASSQELNSEQIQAAYLINFLKHVSWPNEDQKVAFKIAIYNSESFATNFRRIIGDRQIKGKPIRVSNINSGVQGKAFDLVFIPQASTLDISQIAAQLRQTETLLVTDNSPDKYSVINLIFDAQQSAMSFEVNKSNVVFEKLTMSSELLLLGGTELDVATLYREIELAMQKMKQRELELNNALRAQQAQLEASTKRLSNLDKALKDRERVAKQRQTQLNQLQQDIENQKLEVSDKEQQLDSVTAALFTAKHSLDSQREQIKIREIESNNMALRIAENQKILDQQQSEISKQGLQLTAKNEELAERKALIDQQQFYILLMTIVISIALFFLTLVIWLFVKNKRTTAKLSDTLENLKSMQDQLVQSEKLASLGKLTAGIAHEINTPLGIAVTSTSATHESTREIVEKFEQNAITKSGLEKYLRAMQEGAKLNTSSLERVIELLNNFKQVAADQVIGEIREIDIVNYVNEVMSTLSAEIKKHRVDYQYQGETELKVKTLPGALAQVVTNLVTNSLKHGFDGVTDGLITIGISQEKDKVLLQYQDNGNGMSKEVLHNIFEPFFTTKRNSGGTGLGMNIVFNIIRQKLKGDISVESEPGKGSCFTICLPTSLDD